MSTTLSYGYVKPATGDRGSTFFPALEDDIQQLNDHTHNGVDSAFLTPISFAKFTSEITSAGWGSDGSGNYSQSITVPAGISGAATYNDVKYFTITIRETITNDVYILQQERIDSTHWRVRCNDNSLAFTAYYV